MDIGIIGYGNVGKAFVKLLIEKEIRCNIKYILKSDGGVYNRNGLNKDKLVQSDIKLNRDWVDRLSFFDIEEKVDYLVELTPTNMKTGEPAMSYIKSALSRGINVVTGNKGPILINYHLLESIAKENKVDLGIGCTVGGALPSLVVGKEAISGANIESIEGVLNGTSNYILNSMKEDNKNFSEALKEAQDLGIAEKDYIMDIGGFDTAIKIIILSNVLMHSNLKLEDAYIRGIDKVSAEDIKNIKDLGKIKLVGKAIKENNRVKVEVGPEVIYMDNPLYSIEGKNKGVHYKTDTLGDITVIGGASDKTAAAAAILRDIINIDMDRKLKHE